MTTEKKPRPSVLLVEDDTPFAEMVINSLSSEFEFERAANAEEGNLLLATQSFEILLCDHMMPGGQQGLDFLVAAMGRYPRARRILLTGYINPELITRSISVAGLSACLMKPVKMTDLKRIMHEVLGMDV